MFKNIDRWIGAYVAGQVRGALRARRHERPLHIMFACCDHYEPDWGGADPGAQISRVRRWVEGYPKVAEGHADADGRLPRHTFFYPCEVYVKENFDLLSILVRQGYGEVEIHLHHDGATEESLRNQLEASKTIFAGHGFLARRRLSGQVRFAFIHGNWSLNNSRADGKWCGVNDESRVLAEMGCYADFTYPSAPSATQPPVINAIYYASSRADRPAGHHKGEAARVGKFSDKHLLMVQGPLALNFKRRSRGLFPRIENGDITGQNPPTEDRVDLWVKQHIHVEGRPEWVFVKTHTHGAREDNAAALLGEPMQRMFNYLEKKYNDGKDYCLHYVTAREMYNIIKAAEAGKTGNPGDYRDYILERNIN